MSKILYLQVKIHMFREKSNPNLWIHWRLSLPPIFHEAAIAKYHKLGGLKEQKVIFSQFWKLEVQNHIVGRVGFFWGLWERIHYVLLSFLWGLATFGIPWLVDESYNLCFCLRLTFSVSSHTLNMAGENIDKIYD